MVPMMTTLIITETNAENALTTLLRDNRAFYPEHDIHTFQVRYIARKCAAFSVHESQSSEVQLS